MGGSEVRKAIRGAAGPVMLALVLVAGCGYSSKSNSSAVSSPADTATTQASSTPAKAQAPVVISTKHTKLGTILGAGSSG